MKYSKVFTKTLKNAPADEVAKNAQLLIRAGFVYKVMAGVYAYTPLGFRVLEKIKDIVREEMDAIGSQELIMTSLQSPETWKATNRWDDDVVDIWLKTKLQDGTELGLAWSHEEPILEMMRGYINSYQDLPISVHQFQNKLRGELRAKSGIMRGREFVMNDMYSLHATKEDMDQYYEKGIDAYRKVFDRVGLGEKTFVAFASGGAFTKFSHEFQTVCDAGEDILYMNEDGSVAVNEEALEDAESELGIHKEDLKPVKSAETGNIFKFGTEKSEKMDIYYTDEDGSRKAVFLASYGLGVTRLMGVIVEASADDKGLVWSENVAPYKYHLVTIAQSEGDEAYKKSEELYNMLVQRGDEVLWDDRVDARAGEKFADADLIGCPVRLVISPKTLENNSVEVKLRTESEAKLVRSEEF